MGEGSKCGCLGGLRGLRALTHMGPAKWGSLKEAHCPRRQVAKVEIVGPASTWESQLLSDALVYWGAPYSAYGAAASQGTAQAGGQAFPALLRELKCELSFPSISHSWKGYLENFIVVKFILN